MKRIIKVMLTVFILLSFETVSQSKSKSHFSKSIRKRTSIKRSRRLQKNKDYVKFHTVSNKKPSSDGRSWHKVDCKKCNGTGSVTKTLYGKYNRVIKLRVQCPYCKGRGYKGMSRK